MTKKVFATMAVLVAIFAGYSAFHAQNERERANVILTNIEALANGGEADKVYDFWCCGNTCTCAKGEGIVIHGHFSTKPC